MKKGNTYFLVSRERKTNKIEIISLEEDSLEGIDLYTTRINQETTLSQLLYQKKKVETLNNDFFIAYQTREKELQLWEVLYEKEREIRPIARKSLDKKSFEQEADQLLNRFCYQMENNPLFYNMVMYQDTNLYPKFIRYFYGKRFEESYSVKYKDGGWVRKSYPLLRNIVECFSRFQNNPSSYREKDMQRLELRDQLLRLTSKNYNPLQPSLFDFLEEKEEESNYGGYQKRK